MLLKENELFADRYKLIRRLGRGGFSEVWLVNDALTHLDLVLKVYAPNSGMDEDGLAVFCSELAGVYNLNHQNLLRPQHVDAWENKPYLTLSYCPEGSCVGKVGRMTEDQMWQLIHDVAAGLSYLHEQNVVHQDIKPDNILIDVHGNYVITDFGVSTRARTTLRKSVSSVISGGTTAYMGPERFSNQPAPTKASDVWSFGAMCFELLEGYVPFGEIGGGMQKAGADIPLIQSAVSDKLKFVITMMLQPNTWDRPKAEDLVRWASNPSAVPVDTSKLPLGGELPSDPPSPPSPPTPPSPPAPPKPELKLSITPTKAHLGADGGEKQVYVITNGKWSAKKILDGRVAEWCSLSSSSTSCMISLQKNASSVSRSCTIEITSQLGNEKRSEQVSITQEGRAEETSNTHDAPKGGHSWLWVLIVVFGFAAVALIFRQCSNRQEETTRNRALEDQWAREQQDYEKLCADFQTHLNAGSKDNVQELIKAKEAYSQICNYEDAHSTISSTRDAKKASLNSKLSAARKHFEAARQSEYEEWGMTDLYWEYHNNIKELSNVN